MVRDDEMEGLSNGQSTTHPHDNKQKQDHNKGPQLGHGSPFLVWDAHNRHHLLLLFVIGTAVTKPSAVPDPIIDDVFVVVDVVDVTV